MQTTRTKLYFGACDLEEVRQHLRVTHTDEDSTLARMAAAAEAEIEELSGLALLVQVVTVDLAEWDRCILLPVGPLHLPSLEADPVTVQAIGDDGTTTPISAFWVMQGRHPRVMLTEDVAAEYLRITYRAGYGVSAGSVPTDLQSAICNLVAQAYVARGDDGEGPALPAQAARIIGRHKAVRL